MGLIYGFLVREKYISNVTTIVVEEVRHNLFIQGYLSSPLLQAITNQTGVIVNNIIKQELGLSSDFDFNFFLPKEKQRLTLYGLNSADIGASTSLIYPVVDSFFEKNELNLKLKKVDLSSELNLFGEHQDELVIKVNDPDEELSSLNQILKDNMHQANLNYRLTHELDLYNIAKSEQFDYVPHIGLGRIRTTSIKQYIKDITQTTLVLDRINQRILQEVLVMILDQFTKHDTKLIFDSLCITDLQLKKSVKAYSLNT